MEHSVTPPTPTSTPPPPPPLPPPLLPPPPPEGAGLHSLCRPVLGLHLAPGKAGRTPLHSLISLTPSSARLPEPVCGEQSFQDEKLGRIGEATERDSEEGLAWPGRECVFGGRCGECEHASVDIRGQTRVGCCTQGRCGRGMMSGDGQPHGAVPRTLTPSCGAEHPRGILGPGLLICPRDSGSLPPGEAEPLLGPGGLRSGTTATGAKDTGRG